MPKGFYALIAAQFASGLADNALLILGIFILSEQGHAAWWAPFLKFSLNLSYVLLASVVGPLSDAFPKGQVMAWMNRLKMAGLLLMLTGLHPVLAFAVIGLAAAIYAPAKYGLVTESVPPPTPGACQCLAGGVGGVVCGVGYCAGWRIGGLVAIRR